MMVIGAEKLGNCVRLAAALKAQVFEQTIDVLFMDRSQRILLEPRYTPKLLK